MILSLPIAGIGAYLGNWACGLENNIYFQIGLVMLVWVWWPRTPS